MATASTPFALGPKPLVAQNPLVANTMTSAANPVLLRTNPARPNPTPDAEALELFDVFDGNQDPVSWLSDFETIASFYNCTRDTCLRIAKIRLQGPARMWAKGKSFANWAEFQRQLIQRFGDTKEAAVCRLEACWQYADEDIKSFADRFRELADRAGRQEDDALVYMFMQRLQPDLKMEAARQRLSTIDAIVDFCSYWLSMQNDNRDNSDA